MEVRLGSQSALMEVRLGYHLTLAEVRLGLGGDASEVVGPQQPMKQGRIPLLAMQLGCHHSIPCIGHSSSHQDGYESG